MSKPAASETGAPAASTYRGSCHCGAVRFEATTVLDRITECNCSICTKKGILHHRVRPEAFRLIRGEDALTLYRFGTRKARHHFCRRCGIHVFSRPRAAPDQYTINVRCLDGVEIDRLGATRTAFDGRNWEANAAKLG